MARQEIHSSRLPPVAQRPAPQTPGEQASSTGDFVMTETIGSVGGTYFDDLAMMEEPVTIRLEPSSDKNAATSLPVWVNGRGAEILINGKWREITYLPVGLKIIVKRKYLGVLAAAKVDNIETDVQNMDAERPDNRVKRFSSPVHSFSVLEDKNPNGAAWLAEQHRRHL